MIVAVPPWGRVTGRVLSLLMGVLLLFAGPARADTPATAIQAQQRAKAVTQVVLGILSYARWPVEPVPLRLCLVGPTEYADDLIKGNVQNSGQPLQVRRLLADDGRIAGACDAVYIGKLDRGERDRLFQAISGHPVLSISEADDPCTVGSLFCLRVADAQVAFEVNLDSVARSGVRIHPSVLQLSRRRAVQP
ncbi:YfiR family protein [Pseudomonas guariconensis]|uniref:YfiR family protein n=1 Tax=Pseudomonas TaxID=286 RepID=UPI002097DE29|nr:MULTISPECIES: YfiR family protein [Pseudomonas]MCO7642026.1 YfiR family protein [Pseudomonas sp. S 311-6]MCO7516827.1 YfiR family protein [Pseudomonas putida]MCO7567039.1 YfiR family protein [Pseudomonas mosselii]MCO7607198.1 YfiR family protein [Pseudomonas guariconensis]MCO7618375.1 YfiR family protein [Pseudomonas guariconensis]